MKLKFALVLAFILFPSAAVWAQTPTLSCRPLDSPNTYIAPDEKVVGDQVCKIVTAPAPDKQATAQTPRPNVPTTAQSVPSLQPTVQSTSYLNAGSPEAGEEPRSSAPTPCLIVASAEGHRFRDSMIAGALTGGIGFAAGAAAGGAKYAYRDSFDLPAHDMKEKYKGKDLKKIQESGVHVIVVNAKDKTGSEVEDARKSCQER